MSPLNDVGQRTENSSSTCPSCYVGGEGTRLIGVSHVKGMLVPRLQTFRCSDSRTEPFCRLWDAWKPWRVPALQVKVLESKSMQKPREIPRLC